LHLRDIAAVSQPKQACQSNGKAADRRSFPAPGQTSTVHDLTTAVCQKRFEAAQRLCPAMVPEAAEPIHCLCSEASRRSNKHLCSGRTVQNHFLYHAGGKLPRRHEIGFNHGTESQTGWIPATGVAFAFDKTGPESRFSMQHRHAYPKNIFCPAPRPPYQNEYCQPIAGCVRQPRLGRSVFTSIENKANPKQEPGRKSKQSAKNARSNLTGEPSSTETQPPKGVK